MPRRRAPRVFQGRLVSAIESMIPGTVGGRVSNASPAPQSSARAVNRGDIGTVDQASGDEFKRDRFPIAADGPQDVTLTYEPLVDSEHVYLRGLEQDEGTDYTRDGRTLSLLTAMDVRDGDLIDVRYAYSTGAPVAPVGVGPALFIDGAGDGDSSNSASVDLPVVPEVGDLLVFAVALFGTSAVTTPPSGWTHEGSDFRLDVYSKISDGTETAATAGLSGPVGWAALVQVYRGDGIRIASSAFGPAASTSTTCDLPTAAVSGDPLLVGIWSACKTFSGSISITPPGALSDVTTGTQPGRYVAAASEDLTGVTTTPSLTATASATADDGWGAAVLTVAIDL